MSWLGFTLLSQSMPGKCVGGWMGSADLAQNGRLLERGGGLIHINGCVSDCDELVFRDRLTAKKKGYQ